MATPANHKPVDASGLSLMVMGAGHASARSLPSNGEITLGRGKECDVQLEDPKVSRWHLTVRVVGGEVFVIDKGSRNGSFLGEKKLPPEEPVGFGVGDVVRFGSTMLLVQGKPRSGRARLQGAATFAARVAAARTAGDKFALFEVTLRLPPAPAANDPRNAGATLSDSDPGAQSLLTLFDKLLDEATGEGAAIAEIGSIVRRILVPDRSPRVTPETIRASMRAGGVEIDVRGMDDVETDDSDPMGALTAMIDRVAAGHINVLVLGETGVGKEVLARSLHARSPRASAPLVCINCAALSETLLESELFGHEKGAFTGAMRDKSGLLEEANGGVVFLDEVGEMPLSMQAKLLRVLEQREVMRVGSLRPRPIDVRFVAATNRNIEVESRAGRFRQDLYFRLNGVTLTIPPLRERSRELGPLAEKFVADASASAGRPAPMHIAPETLAALYDYDWPGNIRELRNVIERAVLLGRGDTLLPEHLGLTRHDSGGASSKPTPVPQIGADFDGDDEEERTRVLAALEQCAGNQTHAAKLLGISRGTLIVRLAKYNVKRPRKR